MFDVRHRLLVINHILRPCLALSLSLFPCQRCWLFPLFQRFLIHLCFARSLSPSLPLCSLLVLLSHVTCKCSWIGRKTTGSAPVPGAVPARLAKSLLSRWQRQNLTKLLAQRGFQFRLRFPKFFPPESRTITSSFLPRSHSHSLSLSFFFFLHIPRTIPLLDFCGVAIWRRRRHLP